MFRGIETRFLRENGFLSTNPFLNIYSKLANQQIILVAVVCPTLLSPALQVTH